MKENRSVLRKIFLLGFVACLAVLAGVGGQDAQATTCCSTCQPAYENCLVHTCGCNPITFRNCYSQACVNHCQLIFNQCDISCDGGC
jgi:hypothetical protein